MQPFSVIQKNLGDWITSQININVFFYNQNAPRMELPCIGLLITSVVQIGYDELIPPKNELGNLILCGPREFTLGLYAFGDGCLNNLEKLRTSLQKPTVKEAFNLNKLVYVRHFGINNVTEVINTGFEERANMDVLFRTVSSVADDIGIIEHVEMTGTYKTPEDEFSETINIDAE